jgi:hypothetical protein
MENIGTNEIKMRLEKIVWLDACSHENSNEESLDLMERTDPDGTGFLSKNTTYGKIYEVYDEVVVLIQEEDKSGGKDIYAIPRSWILTPKKYRNY